MTKARVGDDVPFVQYLGFETVIAEPGRVVMAVEIRPEYLNSWQVAHGGLLMTLLDATLGTALRTTDPDHASGVAVELKVNFIAPGKERVLAEGRVLHKGGSLAVCEGEVRDVTGKLLAKAVGTYKLIRKKEHTAK